MSKKLMRKKLALMLANLKKKRPFYCELEYLEATGTQYINTGLLSTANSKVDCVFGFSSMESGASNNCAVFGGRSGQTSNTFTLFKIASGNPQYFRFDYNGQLSVSTASEMTWDTTSKYRFEYNSTNCITTNATTGESVVVARSPGSTFTTSPICLFAVNTNNQAGQFMSGRIYKFWYTEGTNTIDLIPVLDWNMTPCMYDKVSGKLFYNQGTGSFVAGSQIHPVDYLESTGTQYINTGWIPNANGIVELKGQYTEVGSSSYSGAYYLFAQHGGTNARFNIGQFSKTQTSFCFDITSINYQTSISLDTDEHIFRINASTKTLSIDDIVFTPSANNFGSTTYPSYLFCRDVGGVADAFSKARVYYCKIHDNGTLVRDYIPAIDENGVGFMFDRVTHTCFLNAGTGVFSYPAREVEYLDGTGTQCIDTVLDYFADFEIGIYLRNSVSNKALGNGAYFCMQRYNSSNPYWYFSKGGGTSNSYTSSTRITEYHVMKWKDNKIYADDVLLTEFTKDSNKPNRMYLYSIDGGYKYPNVIYFCKLWNPADGTLVRDFVPVFKDGVAGMLDKVNNVFYSNIGTDAFGVGKIVEPEYE